MKRLLLVASLVSVGGVFGMQPSDANSYAEYYARVAAQEKLVDQKSEELKKTCNLYSEARHHLFDSIRGTQRIMVGCGTGLGFAASVVGSVLFPNISKRIIVGTVAGGVLAGYVLAETVLECSPIINHGLLNVQEASSKYQRACDECFKAEDELKRIESNVFPDGQ